MGVTLWSISQCPDKNDAKWPTTTTTTTPTPNNQQPTSWLHDTTLQLVKNPQYRHPKSSDPIGSIFLRILNCYICIAVCFPDDGSGNCESKSLKMGSKSSKWDLNQGSPNSRFNIMGPFLLLPGLLGCSSQTYSCTWLTEPFYNDWLN